MKPAFIQQANGFWGRFNGITCLTETEQVLYFPECKSIHTLGLQTGIWLLFLNKKGFPLGGWHYIEPNSVVYWSAAVSILETRCADKKKHRQWWTALFEWGVKELIIKS